MAQEKHPAGKFLVGDILDFSIYENFQPSIIIMTEITWYVLDKLPQLLQYIKEYFPQTYLIHILTTYPRNEQKYGLSYFYDLESLKTYFNMHYLEWAEISSAQMQGCKMNYFVGQFT